MENYSQLISNVQHADWTKDKTIYEVNLRQYTSGGSIKEFEFHLPRLAELGVGILWFMPIHPIGIKNRKGSLGSQYSIRDYKAIDSMYGNINDFIKLVEKCHQKGIKVILDWVANHTAWDHYWTITNPEFYTKDENGNFKAPFPEWADVIDLDYSNHNLWQTMINDMKFWIQETDIDGFRCDMAHLVPTAFWEEASKQLRSTKEIFMLAESENRELLVNAFDAIYNWNIHHLINDVAKNIRKISDLDNMLGLEIFNFTKGAYQMMFTSNHDENSWNGSAIERLHYGLEAYNVLIFTLPSIPLIYSGQEAGNFRKIKFFDKDMIEWKSDKMTPFYQKLTSLKKRNPALWNGEFGGYFYRIHSNLDQNIFAFLRIKDQHKIFVVINFSGLNQTFTLYGHEYAGFYKDVFSKNEIQLYMNKTFNLDPWGYKVLEAI